MFNNDDFIEPSKAEEWQFQYSELSNELSLFNIKTIKKANNFNSFLTQRIAIQDAINQLKYQIQTHNNRIAELKIQNAYALIGDVEGHRLDKQQMTCIVKDTHNHLVIAGAGTGKTTIVVGKIKFLLKTKQYKPEDILVLSFTNASASEMCQRINKETGYEIAASTFHKLGLNIITEFNGIAPKITQLNLRKFIKEKISDLMESDAYLQLLSLYLLYNRVVAKSEFDFQTRAEYEDYLKLKPPLQQARRRFRKPLKKL